MDTKNTRSRKLVVFLTLVMAFTMLFGMTVMARAQAELGNTKVTIGINETSEIWLYAKPDKAKYTFKSNKPSVAKVNKKGEITGVSAGKAKITVSETYKKKTQKVGTITVTVKKAVIAPWITSEENRGDFTWAYTPGLYAYWYKNGTPSHFDPYDVLQYMNPKATYTFYSNSSKLKITKDGKIKDTTGTGTVKITVKETYKKKTRKVGSFKLELKEPAYKGSTDIEMILGEEITPRYDLFYDGGYWTVTTDEDNYVFDPSSQEESDDSYDPGDILEFVKDEEGEWHGTFLAKEEGVIYLYYYTKNYITDQYETDPIAKIKVTVKDYPTATDMKLSEDSIEITDDGYDYDDFSVYVNPYQYTGEITVTSSNPDVVSVSYDGDYGHYESEDYPGYGMVGYVTCSPEAPGTAEIIVKANGAEKRIPVTVISDDYDDEDYY